MTCPACRYEAPAGASRCPRCLEALPGPADADATGDDLVTVFTTADNTLLPVVRAALEAAGIPCVVSGEGSLGLLPLGRFGRGVTRRALGARILVPRSHEEEARAFLRSFDEETPADDGA